MVRFDDFFKDQIEPLYVACIDPERLRRAKAQPWQFLWMFLAVSVTGLSVAWYWESKETGLMVFVGLLLMAELLYLFDYPYPEHESIGFFVPFFTVLTGLGGFLFLYLSEHAGAIAAGCALLLASIAFTVLQDPNRAALTRPYESLKAEVIALFMKQFFPGFQWGRAHSMYASTLENLGIFCETFHEVETGEAIEGSLGNSHVLIESIKLIRVTRQSKGGTSRSTVFKGFLITVGPGLGQQPVVVVRPHRGLALKDAFVVEGHRIELEDPDFERQFDVLCPDEFVARRLMTPALMAKLSSWAEGPVALSGIWTGSPTILSVESDAELFEGDYANLPEIKEVLKNLQVNIDRLLEMVLVIAPGVEKNKI